MLLVHVHVLTFWGAVPTARVDCWIEDVLILSAVQGLTLSIL